MNTFHCLECKKVVSQSCPDCGSGRLQVAGDLHLNTLFVDAYISVERYQGKFALIIKKPSGQEKVNLNESDLLPGF